MKRKEIFSEEQLDSKSRGNEQQISFVSRARIILLKEIIKRLKEIRDDVPLAEGEARKYIETYINERYNRSKIWQTNLAIRREGLNDLLNAMYSKPNLNETPEETEDKLSKIQERLSGCPPETFQEMIGVYLRMKDKQEDTN